MMTFDSPNDDRTVRTLPVATVQVVLSQVRAIFRYHRRAVTVVVVVHILAALAGLVGPWVVGQIIGIVATRDGTDRLTGLIAVLVSSLVAQTVLTWFARRCSFRLSEDIFAQLREEFIESALGLPLSVVERAGTGDLIARTTGDIDSLARVLRYGVPAIIISLATTCAVVVAAVVTSPLMALVLLLTPLVVLVPTRRYLRKAGTGYIREHESYARLNGAAAETIEGLSTIDALNLHADRRRAFHEALDDTWYRERYNLGLRLRWFPALEFGLFAPVAGALLWGGWLVWNGHVTLAAATAVTLYVQQSIDPIGDLISWLDELQLAGTSLARILGIQQVPPDRQASGEVPTDDSLAARDVRYAYSEGHNVLHGVSLDLKPGERLAIVGPSGAGKSTLGRLLAGIDGPSTGDVVVGGVPVVDLELARLRSEVALVTQEHHVFAGTVRDNVVLARATASVDEVEYALRSVDAWRWVQALPKGLDTEVGSGNHQLSEPEAQQIALARLVLADPHTLVLDEATSLLDPRAARHLERSLAAVVTGRTVVAIAHRLHTAHDADRVAVVDDGRITELGSHDELLANDGSYAALWRSWRDE